MYNIVLFAPFPVSTPSSIRKLTCLAMASQHTAQQTTFTWGLEIHWPGLIRVRRIVKLFGIIIRVVDFSFKTTGCSFLGKFNVS